ncbi:glycosyltransferase involved in cell wall biosynthesis [Flavobacterium sp. 28A]|uniref:glycosyltransferase family 2 protein n=1 Tax=Flavobacterium sp. 28A TaxID=2735895 RepID=UPI00156DCE1F|nr:glycosyltransferase [Flavobacterium sp. 28A]NRT15108.1 glycosyltransferase involved in cell wall biosynthesis [Flavobacterium sp. 28A]
MNSSTRLVSVIIPTYKRSEYLIRAIDSVLAQTYPNIEIIVVDDNDGDNEDRRQTKINLNKYILNSSIIYVEHECNKGISAARNTGIKSAKGDFISFLDDDDEFLPNKTDLQLNCFDKSNENLGLVYGSFIRSENGKTTNIMPKYRGDLQSILGLNHIGSPSMIMCRKEVFENIGGFDETFRSREDIEFYYRLAKLYQIDYVEDLIMRYNIHNITLSKIHTDKLFYMVQFISKYQAELIFPRRRWSEIQERLGELNAINGNKKAAFYAFITSYRYYPKRFSTLVKIVLLGFGTRFYRKIRKIT